jgi:nitrite reductase (NADH) small subunit
MTAVTTHPGRARMTTAPAWRTVCRYDRLLPERGVAALVDEVQVAVVRTHEGPVYAISNHDPFSDAYVLSRGIVGSRGDALTIASPMHKQVFDLRTGICLDQPDVAVRVFDVRIRDGDVDVAVRT